MLIVQNPFFLTISEKIKETRLEFSPGSATVLSKMANYEEARVKLTNNELKKPESTAKNKACAILIITKKLSY